MNLSEDHFVWNATMRKHLIDAHFSPAGLGGGFELVDSWYQCVGHGKCKDVVHGGFEALDIFGVNKDQKKQKSVERKILFDTASYFQIKNRLRVMFGFLTRPCTKTWEHASDQVISFGMAFHFLNSKVLPASLQAARNSLLSSVKKNSLSWVFRFSTKIQIINYLKTANRLGQKKLVKFNFRSWIFFSVN